MTTTTQKRNSLLAFLCALIIITIAYRINFLLNIKDSHSATNSLHYSSIVLGFISDLLTIAIVTAILFFVQFLFNKFINKKENIASYFRRSETAFFCILLFVITLIFLAHKRLYLLLTIGFTYPIFISSLEQGFRPTNYTEFMQLSDWIFLVSSVLIFSYLRRLSTQTLFSLISYILLPTMLLGILCGLLSFTYNFYSFAQRTNIIYPNPLQYAAVDLFHRMHNSYFGRNDQPINQQLHSIALIDPNFVTATTNKIITPTKSGQEDWNIVFIVLESVSSAHIFDTTRGKLMPMPFLNALAKKSLWLNNNYATGNTSSISAFGLLTGIYSDPSPSNFSDWPSMAIPTIANWLSNHYEKIFVTAGLSRYYFPEQLVRNGFNEFYDGALIPGGHNKLLSQFFLNEETTADFFLERLDHAKPPFIASYWSGAAHYPYYDYGNPYQIRSDVYNPVSRYENNLNLLDHQIERIYQHLEKNKWLDHTIIVIVGDHGDSFGEHEGLGNWLHGSAMYQEQIKVPLLFYQPKLFKPRFVNNITSSVDILPTLLDAMHMRYDARLIQGESLLKSAQNRKYVFVYGDENELAAIDRNNIKMQISFANGTCSTFNLNNDPHESHPLTCQNKNQESVIVKFRNYQTELLHWYNHKLLAQG